MDNKELNEVTPNNGVESVEPKVEGNPIVNEETAPTVNNVVENVEVQTATTAGNAPVVAPLETTVEIQKLEANKTTTVTETPTITETIQEAPVASAVSTAEEVPVTSEVQNTESTKVEETNTEVADKPREVRIINNEIELIIDEPKVEEEKKEEVVAPVEGKRLLPFIKNDDLFLLVSAIILVVVGLNLDKIHNFFSNKTYKLDPSYDAPIVDEPEVDNPIVDNNEYTLTCTKKNSESDYIFDYVYTLNYKVTANQMIYAIKPIDFSLIEDPEEMERKKIKFMEFTNNEFAYLDNALLVGGSHLEVELDQSYVQTIDLTVANKKEINKVKEVMFFNVDDSFESIKTKFINKGYECK